MNKLTPYNDIPPENWSSKFSIEDIEDFQVSFSATNRIDEENIIEEESDIVIDEEVRWNEPSYINEMRRFIRVIIASEDEATIFIML